MNSLNLSTFVAGCWRLAEWDLSIAERKSYIAHCIEQGITSFDHAGIYGDYQCEGLFGEAFSHFSSQRDKLQIVSKCGIKLQSKHHPQTQIKHYDTSYQHIVSSAEKSLSYLKTDYLDCLLIHRPDPLMNAEEVARAFSDLIAAGKIRFAGVSNFTPMQFDLLQSHCDFRLATNQVEVSLSNAALLEDGTIEHCQKNSTAIMAWSPLGGGSLFSNTLNQPLFESLTLIAEQKNASVAQIALAWLLKLPADLHPIIGSGKLSRISELARANRIELTRTEWFELYKAARGKDVA